MKRLKRRKWTPESGGNVDDEARNDGGNADSSEKSESSEGPPVRYERMTRSHDTPSGGQANPHPKKRSTAHTKGNCRTRSGARGPKREAGPPSNLVRGERHHN